MSKPNDQNPESTDSTRPVKAPGQFRPDSPTPGQKTPHQVMPGDVIKKANEADSTLNGEGRDKS